MNASAETKVVTVQFETTLNKMVSSQISSISPWHQCRDIGWDCPQVSITFEDGSEFIGPPEDAPWSLCEGKNWVSHNVPENRAIYERLEEISQIPNVKRRLWNDAADLSAFLKAPRNLNSARPYLLERDDANQSAARLVRSIWNRYAHEWPEREMQLSRMTAEQQTRGIKLDLGKTENAYRQIQTEIWRTRKLIPWAFEEQCNVRKELLKECQRRGIEPPPCSSASDPNFISWCVKVGSKANFVRAWVNSRTMNLAHSILSKMQTLVRDDGRMDVGLNYHGAHTGRWQSSGLLNIQGLPKNEIAGVRIRPLLVADTKKKFVIADLSQIEPRCLAWLVKDEQFLDLCKSGMNPYEIHARQTMDYRGIQPLSSSNPEMYALAKARVIGLGYGCGAEKFQEMAKALVGLDLSNEEATKVVREYRRTNPSIQQAWESLEKNFRESLGKEWSWSLPSGRKLRYFDRSDRDYLSARLWRHKEPRRLWGGALVQNIVQAFARDVFGEILIRLERHGWSSVFHIHDEVILEVDGDTKIQDIEEEMTKEISWAPNLPLAAKIKESPHFL